MAMTILKGERWRERTVTGEAFRDVEFIDCSFHDMRFSDCRFVGCRFKNCYIGFSCKYEECAFERCSFTGKHSSFGDDCRFSRCTMEATTIRSARMEGVTFSDCKFSGRWQSLMFYGRDSAAKPTVFLGVDLSAVRLVSVDFRCGVVLSSVVFPASGVNVFPNPNGVFTRQLRQAAASLDRESEIALSVLGHEMNDGQNPMVICDDILDDLLDTTEARIAFDRVASEYAA